MLMPKRACKSRPGDDVFEGDHRVAQNCVRDWIKRH
jgi:hypothetical protein